MVGSLQRCYMSIFFHVHGSTCICTSFVCNEHMDLGGF